jgi:hypothetical protein
LVWIQEVAGSNPVSPIPRKERESEVLTKELKKFVLNPALPGEICKLELIKPRNS